MSQEHNKDGKGERRNPRSRVTQFPLTDELGLDLLRDKLRQLLGLFGVIYFVLEMGLENLLHELCGDRRLESMMMDECPRDSFDLVSFVVLKIRFL